MEAAGAGSASGSSSRAATPSYPYPPFDIGMSPSSGSAPSSSLTTTVAAAPALSEDTHRHYHPIDPTPAAAMASLSFATPPSSSPMAGPPQYDPHHSHAHAHAHHAAVDDLAPARSSPSLPGLSTLATPADSTAWQGNGWSVVPPSRGRLTGGWLSGEGVDAGRGCETTAWKGKGKEREAAEEADPELACHQVPSRAASRSASRSTSRVHSRATSPARRNGLRDLWEEREAESEGRIETIDGGDTHHHQDGQDAIMERSGILSSETAVTPLAPPATRKLCVRHQRMADEGTTARLQKVSFAPPRAYRSFSRLPPFLLSPPRFHTSSSQTTAVPLRALPIAGGNRRFESVRGLEHFMVMLDQFRHPV